MWAARSRTYFVLLGLLVVAHFALRPFLVGWLGAPDLATGAVLLAGLRMRPGYAAVLGSGLGVLEGAMALTGMGALMAVYTLAAYGGARSRELIFADPRIFVPLYLLVGVWLVQVAVAVLTGAPAGPELLLVAAPLSAATTAAVCWLVVRLSAPFVW